MDNSKISDIPLPIMPYKFVYMSHLLLADTNRNTDRTNAVTKTIALYQVFIRIIEPTAKNEDLIVVKSLICMEIMKWDIH